MKYYNYWNVKRNPFTDGHWFGEKIAQGLKLKREIRLARYPNFNSLYEVEQFREGWQLGYWLETKRRTGIDQGRIL